MKNWIIVATRPGRPVTAAMMLTFADFFFDSWFQLETPLSK